MGAAAPPWGHSRGSSLHWPEPSALFTSQALGFWILSSSPAWGRTLQLWLNFSPHAIDVTGHRCPIQQACATDLGVGTSPSAICSYPIPSHLIFISILSAGACGPRVPSSSPTPVSKRRRAHLRRLDRRWTLGGMVNRQHSRGDRGGRLLLTCSPCLFLPLSLTPLLLSGLRPVTSAPRSAGQTSLSPTAAWGGGRGRAQGLLGIWMALGGGSGFCQCPGDGGHGT